MDFNNQAFLLEDQNKGEPVTPCMDVYKSNIQSDGSLDKLKLRIVVRGDLQNKEMVGDTWSPTASMRTLKYYCIGDFAGIVQFWRNWFRSGPFYTRT